MYKFDYKQLRPRSSKLRNGIPLYQFPDPKLDLVRLEFIFEAGSFFQSKPIQARACCSLLEGSKSTPADVMSEKFDYYGAYIEKYVDRDQSSIVIYALSRYGKEVLALCEEVFKNPVFPQAELDIYLQKQFSQFEISLQKASEISRRIFFSNVFGSDHPYGKSVEKDDFKNLLRKDLVDFYKSFYLAENACIVISGGYGDDMINAIEEKFGSGIAQGKPVSIKACSIDKKNEPSTCFMRKEGAVQASVRMGKVVMQPKSEDFSRLKVLDYVFGGYFGSRIMQNIREDKGYTYSISSYMLPLRISTVWMISSEVKQGCSAQVIAEIKEEMRKLQHRKISVKELDLVRQVYGGEFLREMDGTLDISEKWKFLNMFGMNESFYSDFADILGSISADEIKETAIRYFDPSSLHCVVVGEDSDKIEC